MITAEELKKFTKLVSQDAWKQEMNTTLNDMVEYICFRVSEKLLEEIIENNKSIEDLSEKLYFLSEAINDINSKEQSNGSKDGGIQKPQRNKKAGA